MSDFQGFYVRRCQDEDALWTVGFEFPGTGRWEPESDHDSESRARQRAVLLNGWRGRYAYFQTEPGLWTVGDCSTGTWDSVQDCDSEATAVTLTITLNN